MVQLCVGILYLWSVFRGSIITAYSAGLDDAAGVSGAATMVSSYMILAFVCGHLIGGVLDGRKGPRFTCFAGVILFSAGVALSAFAKTVALLDLTYAGMAGLGSGFAYAASISCLRKWLSHKRGLASGLSCCAFGLSTVVFTPVSSLLMNANRSAEGIVNFTPVFLTLAVLFAVPGLIACSFISLPDEKHLKKQDPSRASGRRSCTPGQAVRIPAFWALFFSTFFLNGTWSLCVPLIKDLGMERGLPEAMALACVAFTGIANAAGCLMMSSLSGKIGRFGTMYVLCGITLLCAVLLTFIGGYGYFATIALVAFAYGGPSALNAALCTDLFGPKNSGTNYGVAMLALGFSSIFFNFVSKSILHATVENVTSTFIMGAITAIIPVFLMLYINHYLKTRK